MEFKKQSQPTPSINWQQNAESSCFFQVLYFNYSTVLLISLLFPTVPVKAPEFENWSVANIAQDKRDVTVVWKVNAFL